MGTEIPVVIKGNLTADPEHGTSKNGVPYTQFSVAVNKRRLNEEANTWEDVKTVYHRVAVFNEQARYVAASLRKGDHVILDGSIEFTPYTDKDGVTRESRDIIANTVGASLQYGGAILDRVPKASGPDAYAEGPVAAPEATGAGFAR